jgi:hypothetical protein
MNFGRLIVRVKSMKTMRAMWWAVLVFGVSVSAVGQTTDQSQTATTTTTTNTNNDQSQPSTAPAPAFGQNAAVLNPENPPVTGLDEPGLDLHPANRSFFAPALQVSESADTNGANQLRVGSVESVTRVLGAFDLQKFWSKSDLFLEYLGGGAFYSDPFDARQLQAVGFEGVTRWRTGQATVRDAFSYLPDGSFEIGYGGDPGMGLLAGGLNTGGAGGGLPEIQNNGTFGSIGNIPRLGNTAILDVVEALSPRSAVTLAGGYSLAHFFDSAPPPDTLVNSNEFTVEGGYSHLLSRRDQVGVLYAFQLMEFPQYTGGKVYVHVVNARWSHTISGKMSIVAGVGPEYIEFQSIGQTTELSVSARLQLRYKLGRGSLVASYEKFTSPGSGFFAGADTQAARLGYTRPVGRTWQLFADAGYSHNKRLQNAIIGAFNAPSYDEGSAGFVLRKHLGRSYDFFMTYRFTEIGFNTPDNEAVCLNTISVCGSTAQRHIGSIGVEWHPRPIRLE